MISKERHEKYMKLQSVPLFNTAGWILTQEKELIDAITLLEDVENMFKLNKNVTINLIVKTHRIYLNRLALREILLTLVSKVLTNNDKVRPIVNISIDATEENYSFRIEDNGPGCSQEQLDIIFGLFNNVEKDHINSRKSTSIGLVIVKKMVVDLGGNISVTSNIGEGIRFDFFIPRQ